MNKPFFSIVIPCYKLSQIDIKFYKSLVNQKFKDFEVICIDDCSGDNTVQILTDLKNKNEIDIQIYQNENNLGAGQTRNRGIDLAKGEYILFIDSDDYISENALSEFKRVIDSNLDLEVIIYDYARDYGKSISIKRMYKNKKEGFLKHDNAFIKCNGSTCGKCYNLSFLRKNDLKFLKLVRHEDIPFTKHAIYLANKIYYLPSVIYYYYYNIHSLTNNRSLDTTEYTFNAFAYLTEKIDNLKLLRIYFIKFVYYGALLTYIDSDMSNKEIYQTMKEIRLKYKKYYDWKSKYYTDFHSIVILLLFKFKMVFVIRYLKKLR